MTRVGQQNGYILLPVVLFITVIATIAFLINNDTTINGKLTAGEIEAEKGQQVAQAGLAHAVWGAQNSGCAGDMSMTTVPFGQAGTDSYTATVTTPGGATTPYSLTADQDAWFRSDNPTSNSGINADMHLRMESGNLEYALYRFDLSTLPAGAQINSASAWLYVTSSGPGGGAHPEGPLTVHRVTTDWTETGATWDTMSTNFDSAVIASIPAQPQDDVWVRVNLTAQLQAWVNGGEPNFGIMLRPTAEGTHGKYVSREGIASQQPRLEVIVGNGPASPMNITATGTLTGNPSPANDITRSLTRTTVPAYQPPGYSFLQLQPGSGKDAMLSGFYNSKNYGDHRLRVSLASGSPRNALVQFDVAAIPAGAKVSSAQLQLYHTVTTAAGADAGVTVHRVSRDWVEGTQSGGGTADGATWDTWDGTNAWSTTGGDYDPAAVASSAITAATGDWESWDITTLAQGWLDGTFANSGLLLKASGDVNVDFASKEDADPTLHPKLSITYACECGSACLAPQGSGNVLMVVGNDVNPDPEDAYKQSLLEAWGYTVQLINDGAAQADYDAGISNHDVVYISETIDATTLGSKLGNPPIGIVNEEGWKNDDLGFESANSSNWPVGNSIGITDTSHYITALFPSGPLMIYDADMGGLAIDNTPAPDLQSLADWGSDTGLAVLDAGAMSAGGTPTAGRRVMLPFGRDINMDWPHVNSNGLLIMQRALQWGTGNTGGAPPKNLLFVSAAATPSAQEQLRIDLIESWDYSVNLIDDGDSQANFDAAVAANDVVFVAGEVEDTVLGTKLKSTTLGLVNEQITLHDEFGFSSGSGTNAFDKISVVDNTHDITTGFSTGFLTIATSSQPLQGLENTLAPDPQTLATTWISGANYKDGLALLDTGAELYDGGTAAGRRAQLPWGGSGFDFSALNDNGKTIMQRAIEWAEGAGSTTTGPLAHWKLDETSGTTAVDSEVGHDGTLTNGPTWGAGQLDGALNFDGNNDYIDVPHDDTLSLTTFSISAWIRPAALSGWQIVVSKGNTTSWNYYLGTNGSEISIGFNNSGSWTEFQTSGAGLATGQWYHLAGTFDDATGEGKVYLNGALIHTGTTTASPSATSDAVMIGNSPAGEYWPGLLDDVRIYDRVLGDAEIVELATGGSSPPRTVLLVVGDAVTLSSKDVGYKALMESWGHTVTLIDDGDSQTNFNTAMAAADVVYVSGTSSGPSLLDKVTGTTTGVVNEINGKLDNFGFSSSTGSTVNTDTFSKTDALHYITEPFSGNPVTVFTASLTNPVPGGTLAPDLSNVGEVTGTPALVTLDAGATRYDGNPAPGRRVHLPFASADTTDLTADGETILQRALEWAAGAGAGGGGGSGSPPGGVVFEEFTAASRSSNGKSVTVSKPGGTAAGDLLIAAIATDGKQDTWNAPSAGWNLIDQGTQSEEVTLAVWWKLAGSSEPAGYNFSWGEDQEAYAWIMRFTGQDPVNPIDVSASAGGSSTSPSSPAVTTSVADAMILRIGGFDDDDISVDAPGLAGHTAITMDKSGGGNGTCSGGAGYLTQATAGSSGTSTFSLTRSEQFRAVTIGIAPAP